MTLTVVRKGERIPTPILAADKTLEGWARRAAPSDGVTVDGAGNFISEAELLLALKLLRAVRRR